MWLTATDPQPGPKPRGSINDLLICKLCSACVKISSCELNFTCSLMMQESATSEKVLQLSTNYSDVKQLLSHPIATTTDVIEKQLVSGDKCCKGWQANGILTKLKPLVTDAVWAIDWSELFVIIITTFKFHGFSPSTKFLCLFFYSWLNLYN